jgi:hypothetical protein
MVTHSCDPSTEGTEAGGLRVQSHHGLHGETLSSIKQTQKLSKKFIITLGTKYELGRHKLWDHP